MIGYIAGEVIYSDEQYVIVETESGVGYTVHFAGKVQLNQRLSLFVSHIIKENYQALFGFQTMQERKLFDLLLTVNKVGPKSAFSLLASLGVNGLIQSISLDHPDGLKKAKGIGQSAAKQIILSLKDKVTEFVTENLEQVAEIVNAEPEENMALNLKQGKNLILSEALIALEELGFKEAEVIRPLRDNLVNAQSSEDLIKKVLQHQH
jgi:Holliday junction DNA helicase RuvA